MNQNKLIQELIDIGLYENEARVYFASLALGPSAIQKIAEAAEIKRTTTYSVIESLKQKGLMNIEVRGFKKLYVPENPERVESILETRKERFKHLLPEFSALYNLKGGESFIKYYEGLEAVKSVYETLIRDIQPHENYSVVSDHRQWFNLDAKHFQNFTERRGKLTIKIRLLLIDSPEARDYKKYEKNFNYQVKFLPSGTKLLTNMVVIPRRVLIHQLVPPILGIVIENKSVVQMHQQMFEIMWNSLPG